MTTTPDTTDPGAAGVAAQKDPLAALMGKTLSLRGQDAKYRSSVARGLDQATEHYAYPWVLGYVDEPRNKTAYLRAAGLAAAYPDVRHAERTPLGASLKRLSLSKSSEKSLDPAKPDLIASRLATFHEQDLEAAVSTIRRFLDLARGTDVGFDFYAIARMLARWGNGFTDASQSVRSRTVGDYYGAWTNDNTTPAGTTNTNQEL
ncbi:MAG TPA: type I-E CRISPR-associated protein Cse2/CasB [Arthrobacter sp.]